MVDESSKLSNTGHGIITGYVYFYSGKSFYLFPFSRIYQSNTPQVYKTTEVLYPNISRTQIQHDDQPLKVYENNQYFTFYISRTSVVL
jgi:hypothetical protein